MFKNKNIICISSIDWDFIWQGHQEIMTTLAESGNRVLFIENTGVRTPNFKDVWRIKNRIRNWLKGVSGIRKEGENIYIFSPLVIPFPYSRIARWINKRLIISIIDRWVKIMNFGEAIVWTFLPTPLSLDIIDSINKTIVIYYCIDNLRVSSVAAAKISKSEINLLKKADLVFVTSEELEKRCSKYNDKVYFFPFAVNFEKFEKVRVIEKHIPEELKDLRRPIIGYVGGMHKWIDFKLLKEVASFYPNFSFVFIGPLQTDVSLIANLKNVFLLGKKDHQNLPYFVKNFDVCIIPYLNTDYTKNVYPTKLNEYLAMGKPVVSTDLPEVKRFNLENDNVVKVSNSYKSFLKDILGSLNNESPDLMQKRIMVAKNNSWNARIEKMSEVILNVEKENLRDPIDWQRAFLSFYKESRKKIMRFTLLLASIYLLIFYTPLFWFIAGPLKIVQFPKESDCIVVFAGGVGESGMPGQGYVERVKYAVELYHRGYSSHIIFYSGYSYIYGEPLMMKALAVSLGVPEEAIVLEDRARNTYQYVKLVKEILDKRNWNQILLVSSPYHMLRSSLVFNKIARDKNVIYSPIPKSLFYDYDVGLEKRKFKKQISVRQITAILHEYTAIIYYWFKGYI